MNLEKDLHKSDEVEEKIKNIEYAKNLYAALCNNVFVKNDTEWSCTWRYAGSIVAKLRWKNEDYLDFYCSGNEGSITPEVQQDLENLGWTVVVKENIITDQ